MENTGSKINISLVINWDTQKKIVLKDTMQILQLYCPHIYPQCRPPIWVPPRVDDFKGICSKLPVISLNTQEEIKLEIHGKPCQMLVDTRAMLPTLISILRGKQIPWRGKKSFPCWGYPVKFRENFYFNQYK